MEKIFEQFGIQPILLLAQIVNFLVLLFILNKLLYKPLLKVLSDRKQKIEESLKNSERIEQKLVEISQEEEKRILKAAAEGEKIIKQARDMAVEIIEEGKTKAAHLVEKVLEDGRAQVRLDREKMQQEMKDGVSNLLEISLRKIVEDSLSLKDQKEMLKNASKRIKI